MKRNKLKMQNPDDPTPYTLHPTPSRKRLTLTEMFGRIAEAGGTPLDEWFTGLVGMTLLGRLPVLDEIAEYLAFAASDRARSMTGAIANLSAGALVD